MYYVLCTHLDIPILWEEIVGIVSEGEKDSIFGDGRIADDAATDLKFVVVLFEGLDRRTIEFRLETDVEFLKSANWRRHRSIPVFVMNLKLEKKIWLVMYTQLKTK